MPANAKNFADAVIATAPTPATSGLSLTVATGYGARFSAASFNAAIGPGNVRPSLETHELVTVASVAGDVFTLSARGIEGTTPRAIIAGDVISQLPTAADWLAVANGLIFHNARTGTAETLSLADATGCSMNNASASVLTVPLNATAAFPVGTTIPLLQLGAGQVTVSPVSGSVTINSRGAAYKLAGQHAAAVLIQTAVDVWNLSGDITT
jgi:hypothetical protein